MAAERCKSLGLMSSNPPAEISKSSRAYTKKDGVPISKAVAEFVEAWGDEEFWSGDVLDWIRVNRKDVINAGFACISGVLRRMRSEGRLTVRMNEPKQNGSRTGKTGLRRIYRRVK